MSRARHSHPATQRHNAGSRRRPLLRLAVLAFALSALAAVTVAVHSASAVTPSGTVVAWGTDLYGDTTVPAGLNHVTAVAAGNTQSLALRDDGTVVAWGGNLTGQSNVPAGLNHVVAIAAGGTFSVALKEDGTVVTWGGFFDMTPPAGLDHVVAIAAGGALAYAVRDNGTVVAWGYDPPVTTGLTNVVAISAKDDHALALKQDGTVVAWGGNSCGETDVPAGLSGVTAIAAGWCHGVALKGNGTVVAWGSSLATSVPAGLSGVTAIAAGNQASLALKSDGTIVPWGYNWTGQMSVPAGLSGVIAIALGDYHALAVEEVVDITSPEITVPADITVNATSPAGANVTFTVTATDENPSNPLVTCTPPSGSVFKIGDTQVVCSATDAAGLTSTKSFNVHVKGAPEQVADLMALVDSYNLGLLGTALHEKLVKIQGFLAANKPKRACEVLDRFLAQVKEQRGKRISIERADRLMADARRIKAVIGC